MGAICYLFVFYFKYLPFPDTFAIYPKIIFYTAGDYKSQFNYNNKQYIY